MNNEITLHVGYIGKTKDGERVEIIEKISTINPYYRGDNNCAYWPNGRKSKILVSPDDIIGPWEEPKPANNYNDGLWHPWNGSYECPVHPESVVNLKTKYGEGLIGYKAKDVYWEPDGVVIAFTVIKEYKEPREYWIDHSTGIVYTHNIYTNLVHVREVV